MKLLRDVADGMPMADAQRAAGKLLGEAAAMRAETPTAGDLQAAALDSLRGLIGAFTEDSRPAEHESEAETAESGQDRAD